MTREQKNKKDHRPGVSGRVKLLILIFGVGFLFLGFRLFTLQVLKHGELERRAVRQHQRAIALEGERGTIYDRRGRILATNLEVPSIYAVPTSIQGSDQVGLELARVLKSDLTSVKRRHSCGWHAHGCESRKEQIGLWVGWLPSTIAAAVKPSRLSQPPIYLTSASTRAGKWISSARGAPR